MLGYSAADVVDKISPSYFYAPEEVVARARGSRQIWVLPS
jgi:hypothetical protein